MSVRYSPKSKVFFIEPEFDPETALKAGFSWNPLQHRYETLRLSVAARLKGQADADLKRVFERIDCKILDPWAGPIPLPLGKQLDRIQRLGVRHILERNHSYIAFEQGVGKTPTAIAALNALFQTNRAYKTLIVCPPHLIEMWRRSIIEWSAAKLNIEVIGGKCRFSGSWKTDVAICSDTTIGDPNLRHDLRRLCPEFLIVDEAQRFVNESAHRTEAMFGQDLGEGLAHLFDKVCFLSGTPMPNRPFELWPVLSNLAANLIGYRSREDFGIRYCKGFLGKFGWDYRGESNEIELRDKIQGIFMRREEKKDLEHFVGKRRKFVYVNDDGQGRLVNLEKEILSGRSIKDFIGEFGKSQNFRKDVQSKAELGAIAEYRKLLARRKAPVAAKWVSEILETTNQNVILLGWHTRTIGRLARHLEKFYPVVIHGGTKLKDREKFIASFQKGKTRLLVANIACMVGYNIDRANRVVFFEYAWTPGANEQAEDRAHRRTSNKNVLVEYLVMEKTLDEYMIHAILRKKNVINKIIVKKE